MRFQHPIKLLLTCLGCPGLLAAQVAVQVSPGSQADPTIRLAGTAGNTVTFQVLNNGTFDTRYSISCFGTGSVISVSCDLVSPLIAAGDLRTVTATFTVASAGTGTVQLTATATSPTGAEGAGRWNVTVANPAASVTANTPTAYLVPNSASTLSFIIQNTGQATTSYTLVPACSGTGVSAGCTVSPSSVTFSSLQNQTATVSFSTLGPGGTGSVSLQMQYNGATLAQATSSVILPKAAVTPDGLAVTVAPNAGQSHAFTVLNNGTASSIYTLAAVCSGAGVSGCAVSPSTLNLAQGASGVVSVTYNSQGPGTAGTVRLDATYGGALLDSGTLVAAVPGAAVTPDGLAVLVAPSSSYTQVFTVTNTGTTTTTYTLTPVCTGGVSPGCTVSPGTLTLAASAAGTATLSYTTTSPAASSVQLQAKYSTAVLDAGSLVPSFASATVAPDNLAVQLAANTPSTQVFTVTNTAAATATYPVTIECTGSVSGCSLSPTSVASSLLSRHAPYYWRFVHRYVRQIVVWHGDYTAADRFGGLHLDRGLLEESPAAFLGSALVHEAVHLRVAYWRIQYSPNLRGRIEVACVSAQVACLDLLPGGANLARQVETGIQQPW